MKIYAPLNTKKLLSVKFNLILTMFLAIYLTFLLIPIKYLSNLEAFLAI